ncbi:hypothetical protein SLS56_007514 [Neofusicoccum ribis]|uniref:Xylanolytic transcriptional activator regulatory domain-containing protein n=1 Tax=Neofusicoccum ribis TaxID=45134 RepID=A0ABR3SMP6_9PEZI
MGTRIEDLQAEITRLRTVVDDLKNSPSKNERSHSPSRLCALGDSDEETESSVKPAMLENIDTACDAAKELGMLAWDTTQTDSGQSVFYGPTGMFSTPALANLRKKSSTEGSENQTPKTHPSVIRASLQDGRFRARLIEDFDIHVNSHNRFVGQQTLDTIRTAIPIPPKLQLLYTAVIAFGAAVSDDPEVKEMCPAFVEAAKGIALSSCQHHADVYVVQALSILAWLEFGRGNNNLAWIFSSLAGAMVLHQGLHVQNTPPSEPSTGEPTASPTTAERVRTFWSFSWVNRLAAAVLGRTTLIPWQQVSVPPLLSVTPTPTIGDACLSHLNTLWRLHDQHMTAIHAFTFPSLPATQKAALLRAARLALTTFHASIPPSAARPPPLPFFLLHISYHTALLLLHRPFLHSTPAPAAATALRALAEHADAVTALLRRLRAAHSLARAPPFLPYHILRTATVLVLLAAVAARPAAREEEGRRRGVAWPSARLRLCLEALEECGETWPERGRSWRCGGAW